MTRIVAAGLILLVLLVLVLLATGRTGPQELGIVAAVVLIPVGVLLAQRLRR